MSGWLFDRDDEIAAGVEIAVDMNVVGVSGERFARPELQLDPLRAERHLDRVAAVDGGGRVVAHVRRGVDGGDFPAGERRRAAGGAGRPRNGAADLRFFAADDRLAAMAGDRGEKGENRDGEARREGLFRGPGVLCGCSREGQVVGRDGWTVPSFISFCPRSIEHHSL